MFRLFVDFVQVGYEEKILILTVSNEQILCTEMVIRKTVIFREVNEEQQNQKILLNNGDKTKDNFWQGLGSLMQVNYTRNILIVKLEKVKFPEWNINVQLL